MVSLSITDSDIDHLIDELVCGNDNKLSFCSKRREVIQNFKDIQACPGSGKTTLVAAKLLILSRKWTEKYKGICVLTHTNTAKSVILEMLQNHPSGFKLLSYPHFVGTIQEFVDRFLGMPFVRTNYEFKRFSEYDEARIEIYRAETNGFDMNNLCNKLYGKCNKASYADIKKFLGSVHYINEEFDIGFCGEHDNLISFKAVNNSESYKRLKDLKEKLNTAGVFQYKDMYAFAGKLLLDNPILKDSLQNRFPIVFIDEMQDTQEHQDDLLNEIFKSDRVIMQRLGDPDQAIFDGIGGGKPNKTYNDARLDPISDSHRFGNDIAFKIKGLSYNRLSNLGSIKSPSEVQFQHTIFLYDDTSIQNVLDAFGSLIDALPPDHKDQLKVIKAVGGVGHPTTRTKKQETPRTSDQNEKSEPLSIKNYWDQYDKSKASKSFKAKRLIHIVKKCSEHKSGNVSDNYELLLQCVVDLLRKADKKSRNRDGKDVYFSKTSLIRELKETNELDYFRRLLTAWMLDTYPTEIIWRQQLEDLWRLLGLDEQPNSDVKDFMAYEDVSPILPDQKLSATNIYNCDNGLKIEVSTIHGVKAETHDATLILETKYHEKDISTMLDYFIDDTLSAPEGSKRKPDFMKRLYVAASRPRHLLCLAINRENVTQEQSEKLYSKGWNMISLLSPERLPGNS